MYAYAVLRILTRSFCTLYDLWGVDRWLTSDDLDLHSQNVDLFARSWKAFSWKATVWVHWTVAHSGFFAQKWGSLRIFSSIPTERRHKSFKQDLKHSFMGWKMKTPVCLTVS